MASFPKKSYYTLNQIAISRAFQRRYYYASHLHQRFTEEIFPHVQKYTLIYVCDPATPHMPRFLLRTPISISFVFFNLFSWQGYEDFNHAVTVFSPFVFVKGDLHSV